MTGTNNVETVLNDQSGQEFHKTCQDIYSLIEYLHNLVPSANINIIGLLPRKSYHRNNVVNGINSYIHNLCSIYPHMNFLNTGGRYLFNTWEGVQKAYFFQTAWDDDVHLNPDGVKRFAKFLKYYAHHNDEICYLSHQ